MKINILLVLLFFFFSSCNAQSTKLKTKSTKKEVQKSKKDLSKLSKAYFAAGCFWCVEAVFESVIGVEEVISGYAGGKEKNPSYEKVGAGLTGHAESVEVYYDSTKINYKQLLHVFFDSHDPTTLSRQGPDAGKQYRSAIFYQNELEHKLAEEYIIRLLNTKSFSKITTEVSKLATFYPAEDYHQNYEKLNPNNPYVMNVSIPRLRKFQEKNKNLLK